MYGIVGQQSVRCVQLSVTRLLVFKDQFRYVGRENGGLVRGVGISHQVIYRLSCPLCFLRRCLFLKREGDELTGKAAYSFSVCFLFSGEDLDDSIGKLRFWLICSIEGLVHCSDMFKWGKVRDYEVGTARSTNR